MPSARTATIGLTMSLAGTTLAGNINDWIALEGDWTNPANWSMGSVPLPHETTIIANGGHAFLMHQDIELSSMVLGTTVDGRLGYGSFAQYGGTTTIGGLGTIVIGRSEGVNGHFSLSDQASMSAMGALVVGHEGHGIANFVDASTAEFGILQVAGLRNLSSQRTFTGSGFLEVAGPGSLIRTTNNPIFAGMVIGASGSAIVHVRDGGRIETSNGLLASSTSQGSNLIIDGPNSAVQITAGYFDTGRDVTLPDNHPPVGDAILTLRNDGTLDASQTSREMYFASNTLIEGTGTIIGDGQLYDGATINPGESSYYGTINFQGTLDIAIDFSSFLSGGTLHFDIGSTTDFDTLSVHDLIAGGTLEVLIADSFVAQFGKSFDIISADTLTGDFDLIELPELDGTLFFEANVHAQGVTLSVVPAPASLLALALPMLARARRRT